MISATGTTRNVQTPPQEVGLVRAYSPDGRMRVVGKVSPETIAWFQSEAMKSDKTTNKKTSIHDVYDLPREGDNHD